MENEVKAFIKKHDLLHEGATVLIGVSGGPDSMALLHFFCKIRKDYHLNIIALSIDHGLREEQSHQDVEYVRQICLEWKINFYETFLDVPTYKRSTGLSTQVAAREMRYRFFEEQMRRFQADFLALGHHGDDQAETILMRLIRNTTPNGLIGIPVKRRFATGQLIRPFLAVSKKEIEAYCQVYGIKPRRDPSNGETVYTRNHLRHNILPLLREQNPSIHKHMQALSELLREDESYLHQEAKKVFHSIVQIDNKSEVSFNIDDFLRYPFALQRRTYHLILNYLYDNVPEGLSYVHEQQFFHLIHNEKANVTLDFPNGLLVTKSYTRVLCYFKNNADLHYEFTLDVPGQITLPNGSVITSVFTDNYEEEQSKNVMILPDSIPPQYPFLVRTRRPGDRMLIRGLNGTKKVKDIFIDEKIPKYLRDSWPVITGQQDDVLWLVGVKKGKVESDIDKQRYVRLHYFQKQHVGGSGQDA
ncbi:tRNA lysidine(34) synthetase TilS [Aquibacillus salsiterrae]|uniref:tRNA(Ile)-lysidine synthase n=1 Tax=Aquibacillus salsiterrae TaxID=2950439 RepID=A0A9X3WF86_9BACI|nr:tRNA lysidine(34) synthetase TilS [Aquibacillus salsiterrae]MDC3417913.1 tRNA lysidine(34) synthetase TilS [Aquibacillus salsiterrae]